MADNKNAIIRYKVLDKCFRNNGRKYFYSDLLDAVNKALIEYNPNSSGIKMRQLKDDVNFMESEAGYSAPILRVPDGRKKYLFYEDRSFSINRSPLNTTETEQLKNAIAILLRFEGSPESEWITEIATRLKDQFGFEYQNKIVGYETNLDYKGYKFISPLFNAIVNKRVLRVTYEPFNEPSDIFDFHPHYLKQYNNRWFVLGKNENKNIFKWNLALDRIKELHEIDSQYVHDNTNWNDYFDDFIGVTKKKDATSELVRLHFSADQAPYIKTKPLHLTQKYQNNEDGSLVVSIDVIINYELEMKILSFGEKVTVLEPASLVKRISDRLENASKNYK